MHLITFVVTVLIAFTSTTSAGTLHDRRRDNRLQIMRRNRGPILDARHNGQPPGGVEAPVSSALSTSDAIITTTTALEGLNSTIGLTATATIAILKSATSEVILTSETAAVDSTACPPAVTVTVTKTVLAGGETQTGGKSASIGTTITELADPASTTNASASIVTTIAHPALTSITAVDPALPAPTDGSPPFTFIPDTTSSPPAATNIAEVEQPAIEKPAATPLEDGDVTTQIFTQTVTTPAATLVLESIIRRGRSRGKVVTITEETEESVETEIITLVVTQSERIELVTNESGVAETPTAIVVDGIASEVTPAPEIPAVTESAAASEATDAAQTSELITDGNAPIETSTSCTDAGITITSAITVDATAPAAISAAPEIPDANENIVSMISVITLTKSAEPFITTTNIDGVPALITATPEPELVLSTITLGGATGTDTEGAQPTGGQDDGNGKGRGKGRKNKNKGNKGGNGRGQGDENDEEDVDEDENGNGAGNGKGRD